MLAEILEEAKTIGKLNKYFGEFKKEDVGNKNYTDALNKAKESKMSVIHIYVNKCYGRQMNWSKSSTNIVLAITLPFLAIILVINVIG